jgi:hypothetical protein
MQYSPAALGWQQGRVEIRAEGTPTAKKPVLAGSAIVETRDFAMGRRRLLLTQTWYRLRWRRITARKFAVILSLALCCWAMPTRAEPPKSIGLELNKLEEQGGNCRAYLVIANPGSAGFSGFTLDLVLFDRGGTIMRRLAVDIAPVRPDKTMVKVFDIPGTACGAIGSILVNDVLHCRDANADVVGCVDRVRTSSKLPVTLSK